MTQKVESPSSLAAVTRSLTAGGGGGEGSEFLGRLDFEDDHDLARIVTGVVDDTRDQPQFFAEAADGLDVYVVSVDVVGRSEAGDRQRHEPPSLSGENTGSRSVYLTPCCEVSVSISGAR